MATVLGDITTLINDRRRDSGSNSINMSAEGFRAINSTLDMWNQIHDWEWQIEESIINYNEGITYYSVPSGFKAPIDLRPYRASGKSHEFDMVTASGFDSETLKTKRFSVTNLGQTEYLRIKYPGDRVQIHTLGDITDGTWATATAVSNLATDSYDYFDLSSSVSFDYAGTTGTITITLDNAIDLTKYLNRSSIYWNTKFTTYTNWTSITLKLGSSASAYYTASATTDYLGRTPTASQWNKHKIAWSSFSKVLSPNIAAINYIQFTIAYASDPAMTAARIENLFISADVPLTLEHYTTNMVCAISSSAKTQKFATSTATNDFPLWSGKYDFVNESFCNSVLENIFFMTGEQMDLALTQAKVTAIVMNLRQRIPSKRRYPEATMKFDIN